MELADVALGLVLFVLAVMGVVFLSVVSMLVMLATRDWYVDRKSRTGIHGVKEKM